MAAKVETIQSIAPRGVRPFSNGVKIKQLSLLALAK